MKKSLLLLLGYFVCTTGWAQCNMSDTLSLVPVSPTNLWDVYKDGKIRPKRIPPRQTVLPTCLYADGQICMTAKEDWGAFTYYILTDEHETVLTGGGILTSYAPYYVDLSPLESGCYTFVLQHGGYYGATFAY